MDAEPKKKRVYRKKPIEDIRVCKGCGKDFAPKKKNPGWQCNDCINKQRRDKKSRDKTAGVDKPKRTASGACDKSRECKVCEIVFAPDPKHPRWVCDKCRSDKRKRRHDELLALDTIECVNCGCSFTVNKRYPRIRCIDCAGVDKIRQCIECGNDFDVNIGHTSLLCDECINKHNREYQKNNKDKIALSKKRQLEQPSTRFRHNFSALFRLRLKQAKVDKTGSSMLDILPYTMIDAMKHLESLFEPWMTWENWGKYDIETWDDNDQSTWTWQIDHIIPTSTFEYSSIDDPRLLECWALNNLRPLAAKTNIHDGNRGAGYKTRRKKEVA